MWQKSPPGFTRPRITQLAKSGFRIRVKPQADKLCQAQGRTHSASHMQVQRPSPVPAALVQLAWLHLQK